MPKKAIKFQAAETQEASLAPFHYFLSSCAEWRTGDNLDELIATMKKAGYPFNTYKVPGHKDDPYEIAGYAPRVTGAVFIGFWGFDPS